VTKKIYLNFFFVEFICKNKEVFFIWEKLWFFKKFMWWGCVAVSIVLFVVSYPSIGREKPY